MTRKDESSNLCKHLDRSPSRSGSNMLFGNTQLDYDHGRAVAMQHFSELDCP